MIFSRRLQLLALLALTATVAVASAQPTTPPAGPADVINGANAATDAAESERNLPDDAEPADAEPSDAEQERLREQARRALSQANEGPAELAVARRDPSTPPGTIRVQVVDANNQRVAGADVRIGIMAQAGVREEETGVTDANGQYQITGLATGEGQAYRVTVPVDGAVYATTPFRLEVDAGHIARVVRVDTTRDTDPLLIQIGQTLLEYRNERVHITEQLRLTNLGRQTVVFGEDGLHFDLPEGFTAFQTQPMMTDQRLIPDDTGFVIKGSIPPGTVLLAWVYDIPLHGAEVGFSHPLPFKVYRYRVMTDASATMRLDVAGFPPAEVREADGRRLLVTEVSRGPSDPRLEAIQITVRGIPGPGPMRWLALGAALILLMLGLLLFTRLPARSELVGEARSARRDALIAEAKELSVAFAASEIGPKYHARRMGELEAELASLLRMDAADEERARTPEPKSRPTKRNQRRGA